MVHRRRSNLPELLRPGDLVIANDAATIPASLHGTHQRTGSAIEVRLAVREADCFRAVVFGEGDFHMRTEDRSLPPAMTLGDRLVLGPITAIVRGLLGHPRLLLLELQGNLWSGLALHGKPVQYSHMQQPLQLWDVWTPIAARPVAFESPSASFTLSWEMIAAIRDRGAKFATITHAAGISSTGNEELDRLLPFDEPYIIPAYTANAIKQARVSGGRVIAIGTTVVRALEHAAKGNLVVAGSGIANQKIGAGTRLQVVDAIFSGTHEPDTSHFELLRAFTEDSTLLRASDELNANGYLTHEFGDSVLIERRIA